MPLPSVPPASGFSADIVRFEDLLVLRLRCANLAVQAAADGTPELLRSEKGKPARITVELPPQHLGEQAYFAHVVGFPLPADDPDAARSGDETPPVPPAIARILSAGPTRLAFDLPADFAGVPWRLADVLALLRRCLPRVVATALPGPEPRRPGPFPKAPQRPPLSAPAGDETAIELPYRLILSPPAASAWVHAELPKGPPRTLRLPPRLPLPPRPPLPPGQPPIEPPNRPPRVELWHTRLAAPGATEADERRRARPGVRAVWARSGDPAHPFDPGSSPPDDPTRDPFRMSLDAADRADLVHLTADFTIVTIHEPGGPGDTVRYVPIPVAVRQLALSALGAWVDARGAFATRPPGISLSEWRHIGAMGRDQFVRIVRAGYLFPLGHPASLVKVTERRLEHRVAALRQRMFLVVREPVLRYDNAPNPAAARQLPFTAIRLETLVTPDIDQPRPLPDLGVEAVRAFRVDVGGQPLRFHVAATDREQRTVSFTLPLFFLDENVAIDEARVQTLLDSYGAEPEDENGLGTASTGGAAIALAPPGSPGDTTLDVHDLTFGAVSPHGRRAADRPAFFPQLRSARAEIPAVKAVTGDPAASFVSFHPAYVAAAPGATGNPGQVWASVRPGPAVSFHGKGDLAGALATPNLAIQGLSRTQGPIADATQMAAGNFRPEVWFKDVLGANLLGVLDLASLISAGDGTEAPALTSRRDGDDLVAELRWEPTLKDNFPLLEVQHPDTALNIHGTVRVDPRHPQDARHEVTATLKDFTVHLFDRDPDAATALVSIKFDHLTFKSETGHKPDPDCKLADEEAVKFHGALEFVDRLRELIPSNGFSDPPDVDVTKSGLSSTFSTSLPDIALGVFTLQHLSLSAGWSLPFADGPMAVRFAFCERHEPFVLSVAFLGGGGFFAIVLDPKGVQRLEAAFEFGASVSIDLGVASGGVHVLAGIYLRVERHDGSLTGYLRMGGELSVLGGLFSASIELYMSLTYEFASGKVVGRATLTIEVHIIFFSISIDITVERKFAGSASDPSFADLMSPHRDPWDPAIEVDPWAEYCAAYV